MPRLKAIVSGGASGRRVLEEVLDGLDAEGYVRSGTVEGGEWSALISTGRTGGLFDARRVMVVEGADFLGPFPDVLLPFLEDDGASEIILLVFDGVPTKIFSPAVKKKVDFLKAEKTSLAPWERKGWMTSLAVQLGIDLSDDGASILAEMIDDPEEIRSELEKLGQYASGGKVDGEMVKGLSFDEGRSRMLTFLDSFCMGKPGEVFSCLEHLKKENSVLPILTALYNRLRPALYLSLFPEKNGEWVRLVLQIKEYPLKMGREALRRYSRGAITDLVVGLLALSWNEKTPSASGWLGFEALLVRCMESADGK